MRKPLSLAVALCASMLLPAQAEPLKVYILAGQSNMEGHAHVDTFAHVASDPASKSLAALMLDGSGKPRTAEHTWISYLGAKNGEDSLLEGKLTTGFGAPVRGPKIGPEYTFGLTLEKRMSNPILLIKTAWGGRSLSTNFRPPSAGPYKLNDWQIENAKKSGKSVEENEAKIATKAGVEYRQMVAHVKDVLANIKRVYPDYDPKQGYELAGFVWFQGWNDMCDKHTYPNRDAPDGYDAYSTVLGHFIRDVRKDLDAPNLPFVIGVMGQSGIIDEKSTLAYPQRMQNFRNAQAAPAELPEFKDNVHVVLTEKYWDPELGAIDDKWEKLKGIKQGLKGKKGMSKEELNAAGEAAQNKLFTPDELKLKELAMSNAGYHYLGSAKILGNIGIAFADALVPAETK